MITLNTLSAPKGSTKKRKRIGRGQGSGQGTQAGKGHKGQKARSGGGVRIGFEGGSMPIYMRLPKRGEFSNAMFKKHYAVVSLDKLDSKFEENEVVSKETLVEKGLLKGQSKNYPVKLLNGKLTKKLAFKGISKFTKTAESTLKNLGATIE